MDRVSENPGPELSDKAGRTEHYLPAATDEAFCRRLNEVLAESPEPGAMPAHPVVLVAGAPRSGTTFLAQALCRYFRADYPDNLAAKFWLAPVTGLRLSRMVFGQDKGGQCVSEFGRTTGADIHGFHYFWMHHLKLDDTAALFQSPASRGVEPGLAAAHLAAMQRVSDRALVMKGYYPSYVMDWFCRSVPAAVFVLVRRTPLDEARSIYLARKSYMRDVRQWWSMYPPEYADLTDQPVAEQIAGQIFGLRRMYARLGARAGSRVVAVDYDRLLDEPGVQLARIHRAIESMTGMSMESTGRLPEIHRRETKVESDIERDLAAAIERYAPWDEPWPFLEDIV